MKRKQNPELIETSRFLKTKTREFDAPIWRTLAEKLEKPKHSRCAVNLSRINRYTKDGETVTVPGKVLGSGTLDHKVSVAAFSFSEEARRKVEAAGGKCLIFSDLVKKNHKGKDLKIIG
ncbi:MAG: 50S ribosomal protein L18e [Candidatus Bathyarchaeota archaeon]